MKAFFEFIRTTIVGGLIVILPAGIAIMLLARAVRAIQAITSPIVNLLPEGIRFETLVALLLIFAGCFFAGLLVRSPFVKKIGAAIEKNTFERLPLYQPVRSLIRWMAGIEENGTWSPCLAVIENALVPAFVVEEHSDGRVTVFVPSVPALWAGAVYILPKDRVHRVNVPMRRAIRCMSRWGAGSEELLAAMQTESNR